MTSLGWRLRTWMRLVIPHTRLKRWGYAGALCSAIIAGVFLGPALGGIGLIVLASLRTIDIRVGRRRRGGMPTEKAYFFEGQPRSSRRS